ncbi:MAG: hypothetical protein M1821_008443 [Bathelium mastoideum]|nr:MAG: hypothetical protein M1821_008443 [Bathelium mastoideum]KAI9687083.1 MAG: hypothetical protein M1822_002493 [Bathelium mastoideum]
MAQLETNIPTTNAPITTTSADLRAPSIDEHRFHARAAKYNSFRHVSAGQLGAPHYQSNDRFCLFPADFARDAPVVTALGKRELWAEARHAAPPVWHRSYRRDKMGNAMGYALRRERERERGREWKGSWALRHWREEEVAQREIRVEQREWVGRWAFEDWLCQTGKMDDGVGGLEQGDYGILVERAREGWEEKRMKAAQKAGWDVVSEVASVCSEETDAEASDYELV